MHIVKCIFLNPRPILSFEPSRTKLAGIKKATAIPTYKYKLHFYDSRKYVNYDLHKTRRNLIINLPDYPAVTVHRQLISHRVRTKVR